MSIDQLRSLLTDYESLCKDRGWFGQVTFAGGEPFVRKDFIPLLREMRNWSALPFAILTNGTFIDEDLAIELETMKPVFVQISLEGSEQMHDSVRGEGDFKRCLNVLSLLARAKVRTSVSFTAHRANFRDFPLVAEVVRQTGANTLWSDRLVPIGRGSQLETLSSEETRAFFELMNLERVREVGTSPTRIAMRRSLQFLCGGDSPYQCTAGKRLLAVLPDGTVYPCRRLPISLGNVLTMPFNEIYEAAKAICDTPTGCKTCEHFTKCGGGSRCVAYAVHGKLSGIDPGCWMVN